MTFGPIECLGTFALLLGLAIPILILTRGTTVIGEGQVAVIERRGRFARLLHAGQHALVPGMESIRAIVPLQEFTFETGSQKVLTKNLYEVEVNALVHYQIARRPVVEGEHRWHQIDSEAVYHAVYSAENWQEATHREARAMLAEVFSSLDLRFDILEAPGWQDQVAASVRHKLNENCRRWGVQVTDVAFTGVEFPPGVKDTISTEARLHREAQLREIEAASLKELAQTLNLSPSDLLNWRYVETLREMARNPQARIVVSPEPFAPAETEAAASQEAG